MSEKKCEKKYLRISWSSLRTHSECKQRGYLMRQGKKAPLEDTRNYFPGTVTDRVVRDWLNNDPEKNLGVMPDMVSEIIDRERTEILESGGIMRWRDKGDRETVRRDCIEAVTKIEPLLLQRVTPFEYQPDFRFEVPVTVPHPDGGMETILLLGYMDILVRDDNQDWWVWDVKHTRDNSYWRKTVGQLGFYDLSVELMFGKPTVSTGLLQPLCKQGILPYTPSPESRAQLMQRIIAMANDVWRGENKPRTDTSMCSWCPVKHACSKFEPVNVGGKRRISL